MDYSLTLHAKQRLKERNISRIFLKQALDYPTKIGLDAHGNVFIKKLFSRRGKTRLLLVAGTIENEKLKIFTIIDTSKVSKYL